MNILLTSAGRRTYLVEYFKHALRGRGKVYASNSVDTYTLHQADGYVLTPGIYDEGYIAFLMSYCRRNQIAAIISLFDIDLPVLARHKADFEREGIKVVVSDYNVTQICNDKWQTYEFLVRLGLPQTPSYLNLAQLKCDIAQGVVCYPFILKPRWGMGSIGIYRADNEQELDVLYAKLHHEIFATYLKYESQVDKDSCIIIQQMISGQEYGIEILNDLEGNYVTTFAKKKIAMRSGETDIAETVNPEEFAKLGEMISCKLKHVANLDVDCFKTETGKLVILEMNCRFGGQYPFTHNSGVDVPQQIVNWLEGKETDMELLKQKNGVVSCKELRPVVFMGQIAPPRITDRTFCRPLCHVELKTA